MDTTTKIMMRILDDLYSTNDSALDQEYSKYYESLDNNQSRTIVTEAINKILKQGDNRLKCEFGEYGFKLSSKVN